LVPDPAIRRERELARFRWHLVKHRSMLKHRVHTTLIMFGHPCPGGDSPAACPKRRVAVSAGVRATGLRSEAATGDG
jgi:hypothetical protein